MDITAPGLSPAKVTEVDETNEPKKRLAKTGQHWSCGVTEEKRFLKRFVKCFKG